MRASWGSNEEEMLCVSQDPVGGGGLSENFTEGDL